MEVDDSPMQAPRARTGPSGAIAFLLVVGPLVGAASNVLCADDVATLELKPLAPSARTFARIEIAVALPDGVSTSSSNAFDPDEVALDAKVKGPKGPAVDVAGFLFQEYDRRLDRRREVLTPRGEREWRIRYTPVVSGPHHVEAFWKSRGKTIARGEIEIDVATRDGRGFVRVEETSKRYFRFDDGTPLFLNGVCCCWHGRRGTFDYDDWLDAYRDAGMNYIRIWMWPNAFGIEWDRGDRLNYRLDRAWTVDRVLAECERRGILVMLCFDFHGMFRSKADYWGGNNYWPSHPYNKAHGGPCERANDFFTLPAARRLYEKRLRYMVARWGSFTNLLAWQFFNEIDNAYDQVEHADVVSWHRDMARHLRAIDPYDHLITTSLTGSSERGDYWRLPELDFSQFHSYNAKRPAAMTRSVVTRFHERYGKPIFVGEYGTDWRGWRPKQDPYFRALHQAVWSGAMTGGAGTAMSWWWESIHRERLHGHWTALGKFLDGTAIARAGMEPARIESIGKKVEAYGVATRRELLGWLLDPAFDWPAGGTIEKPTAFEGAGVRIHGLDDGAYRVEWWDTSAGKRVRVDAASVSDGVLELEAPGFRVDVGLRVQTRADATR